jgi:hypothetical protein
MPPNNPAKTLFRIILWILPTGFAVICGLGCFQLPFRTHWTYEISLALWIILTSLFTAGAGWFNVVLSNRGNKDPGSVIWRTFLFFIAQILLIPLLLGSVLYAACLMNPLKF